MKRNFDKSSGILTLTLDHPERGNSLGSEEAREFQEALKIKGLRALLLRTDEPKWFCTGGNLAEQASMADGKAAQKKSLAVQLRIRAVLTAIEKAPFPTAVALTGDAFGGGVEHLSAFDHVIAAPHIFLGLWQRKVGLVFGWGGGERLLARLGPIRLRNLSLEARLITAHEARRIGLVDRVVNLHEAESAARTWLQRQLSLPEISFEPLKSWAPAKSSILFSRLWMNPVHKSRLPRA